MRVDNLGQGLMTMSRAFGDGTRVTSLHRDNEARICLPALLGALRDGPAPTGKVIAALQATGRAERLQEMAIMKARKIELIRPAGDGVVELTDDGRRWLAGYDRRGEA